MAGHFTIVNETQATLPRVAFRAIKEATLGKDYGLSLVIVSPSRMKKLNAIYRDKNTPTDILSFPISEKEGEMYVSPREARREAKKFARSYENFLPFLFIHGCVHLKGYDHGVTMESIEEKIRDQFGV